MRLTFCWRRAARLPTVIESTATTQSIGDHTERKLGNISYTTRRSTANAAALGAVDIRATTGVGEPSYTSGVHTWNGAAETLNRIPTSMSASDATTKEWFGAVATSRAIS